MLLKCDWCDKEFEKRNGEYNRRIKKNPNTKFFCCRSCSTSYGNKINPRENVEHLKRLNRADKYSPFRFFIKNARNRNKEFDIDVKYIKSIWERQNGICPFTGIKMILPIGTIGWETDSNNQWRASLDRIDSSKGYIKGNVQFVCYIANMCKRTWSDETVIDFCKKVAEYNG